MKEDYSNVCKMMPFSFYYQERHCINVVAVLIVVMSPPLNGVVAIEEGYYSPERNIIF